MPTTRRRRVREQAPDVSPSVFDYGDGTWSLFPFQSAYASEREARKAWRDCRSDVWARTHRGHIPAAATIYDGITADGWRLTFESFQHNIFPIADVRAAFDADEASLLAFRRRDRAGAREIETFLSVWLGDLHRARLVAERWAVVSVGDGRRMDDLLRGTAGKYGDAVAVGSGVVQ